MGKDDKKNLDLENLSDLDKTIHSPTRLKILAVLLTVEEADFTFIARTGNITRGNLSANLQKLESEGYIKIKKMFVDKVPKTIAQITPAGREALAEYSSKLGSVLDELRGYTKT